METYLLVSGDFTTWGGMDRANYELAWHLADRMGASVHLVSHFVAPPLAEHPGVNWHRVPKPLNRYALAGPLLAQRGRRVAKELTGKGARVVINGGSSLWSDVNWVHAVHAAWNTRHAHAPALFRLRASWLKQQARRAERRALRAARIVVTNSEQARQQVIDKLGIAPERVHAVYYGIDPQVFRPVMPNEKAAAKQKLGWPRERPVMAFIGAMGHDRNKGFDLVFTAWELLCKDPTWDVDLVASGSGAEVDLWRRRSEIAGLNNRMRILGFTKQIPDILAAADALVSPSHYDAYGLGVHEALCCGLPALVTHTAGVAEHYPEELVGLLIPDPDNIGDLVERLKSWRQRAEDYKERISPLSQKLRTRTWKQMAEQIVNLINVDE